MDAHELGLLSELGLDVLMELDRAKVAEDFQRLLFELVHHLKLKNVVYHCPNMPGHSLYEPYILLTYNREWIEHYRRSNYIYVDPIFKMGSHSLLPFDWNSIPKTEPRVVQMFEESRAAGVGRQGVTIPIRGPENGIWALFSATTDDSDDAWPARKREILGSLISSAYYLHKRVYELHKNEDVIDFNAVTKRESEALSWVAEGKTIADVAVLMAISPETVKAHLDSARFKLGALNRVHAVTRAIRHGIIR